MLKLRTVPEIVAAAVMLCSSPVDARPAPVGNCWADSTLSASLAFADEEQVPEGVSASDWSSIRAAHEANRHAAFAIEDGYQARNPGQGWRTQFDCRGFLTSPDGGGWSWGLQLISFGRAGAECTISGSAPALHHCGQRVEYDWDAALTEWYINDQRGLEHGYTVHQRPDGSTEPLQLTLSVRGDLLPRINANNRDVAFVNTSGAAVVNYSKLMVFDANGVIVPAGFETGEANQPMLRIVVDDSHAVYPLTIDPIAQQAYLKASNPETFDSFGRPVAVSGNTVVVGAQSEDSSATGVNGNQADNSSFNSGAVYIFVRSGGVWSQQAYLKASNTGTNDTFGHSVAVSGDTVVIGAISESSSATGVNGNQADNSAHLSGAAYVFVRNGTTWSQQAYLKASNTEASDQFGITVAVSGDTVVVGADNEASSATGVNGDQADNSAAFAGAAYVFVRSGTTWTQQAYLKASNTESSDSFSSVAASGDTIVIGASNEGSSATGVNGNQADNSASGSGAAYVFARSGGVWSQQAYLKASNTGANDSFGNSVAASGDTVVVGAFFEDSSAVGVNGNQADNSSFQAGAAYVFVRSGNSWSQQAYLKASNTGVQDQFARTLAVSGNTVVVGGDGEDSSATGVNGNEADNSASGSGAAYVFVRRGTTWTQQAYLKASNTGAGDFFGDVGVSGDMVVVGAHSEDSSATGVNGNQTDNSVQNGGAAYIFTGLGLPACPADIAPPGPSMGDGLVNVADLLTVISAWGQTGDPPADLNDDNIVNVVDLLAVIGAWGVCD